MAQSLSGPTQYTVQFGASNYGVSTDFNLYLSSLTQFDNIASLGGKNGAVNLLTIWIWVRDPQSWTASSLNREHSARPSTPYRTGNSDARRVSNYVFGDDTRSFRVRFTIRQWRPWYRCACERAVSQILVHSETEKTTFHRLANMLTDFSRYTEYSVD